MRRHQLSGERAYLIVPEQFTYENEERLIDQFGGLIGIEVLSFDRLAERVLSLSGRSVPFLNQQGLAMIVRRAILHVEERLTAFRRVANRPGFGAKLAGLITKLVGAGIDADSLRASIARLPKDGLLTAKLTDIAAIYEETMTFCRANFLTPDDALNAAASALPKSFIKGAPIYIDGFEGATHAVYMLTRALFQCASSVTIALTLDPEPSADAALFQLDREVYDRLTGFAAELGLSVTTHHFSPKAGLRSKELSYAEKRLFSRPLIPYLDKTAAIRLIAAPSREGESERVAESLLSYVKTSGCHWRDVAVLCSDLEAYALPLSRAMAARGIPYYIDMREKLQNHALCRFLLSSVQAVSGGYALTDLMSVLKGGFLPIAEEDADILENYILQHGLYGSQLTKPLSRGEVPPAAEAARAVLMGALMPLGEALKGRTVHEKVLAVYDYLVRQNVKEQLSISAKERVDEGRLGLYQLSAQAWNRVMALLSQLDSILGAEQISREDFATILEEGVQDTGVGLVPAVEDGVLIGEALRTRTPPVDALFLVGVNDGLLPHGIHDDGILDDRETKHLQELGLTGLRGTAELTAKETRGLYLTISKAKTALTLSCALTADGSELLPSPLFHAVSQLFPNRETVSDTPASMASILTRYTEALSRKAAGKGTDPLLPSMERLLLESEPTLVQNLRRAAENQPSTLNLRQEVADLLYSDLRLLSASRLESFNACPFRSFASYGLNARPRKEFCEEAADLGSLYHAVLDAFIRTCIEQDTDYAALTEADIDARIRELLPAILASHNDGYYLHNDRARGTLPLIIDTLHRTIWAVCHHIRQGGFRPVGSELRFGPGCAYPPIPIPGTKLALTGVIDRMDATRDGAVRIVDYKTNGRNFEFAAILFGLTLQLPLYLDAVAALATPSGAYYMPIRVPFPEAGEGAIEELIHAFRLNGITLNEASIIEASDRAEKLDQVIGGLSRTKTGELKGNLLSAGEIDMLLRAAKQLAANTARSLLSGEIRALPVKDSCDYCVYRGLCRFEQDNPACRTRRVDKIGAKDFFAIIGGSDAVDK